MICSSGRSWGPEMSKPHCFDVVEQKLLCGRTLSAGLELLRFASFLYFMREHPTRCCPLCVKAWREQRIGERLLSLRG